MYSAEHCADGIFFGTRPNNSLVVAEDDFVGREVRRVHKWMERLETNGCLQRSRYINMAREERTDLRAQLNSLQNRTIKNTLKLFSLDEEELPCFFVTQIRRSMGRASRMIGRV